MVPGDYLMVPGRYLNKGVPLSHFGQLKIYMLIAQLVTTDYVINQTGHNWYFSKA